MTTKELRIGNYISVRTSSVAQVSLVGSDYIEVISVESEFKSQESGVYLSSEHEAHTTGIPLSDEWFIKLGYVKSDDFLFMSSEVITEKCKGDNGFKRSSFFFNKRLNRWMDCQTRVCVDYVHQLQNLVFALTGEELEWQT